MQCKIPDDMRAQLADDPFMERCAHEDIECEGRIEWHHAFTYAGKRVNELWSILPLCRYHHDKAAQIANFLQIIMHARMYQFDAIDDFKEKYPKSTLI